MRIVWAARLILRDNTLFGEEYKLWSPSFYEYNLLDPTINSHLLGPCIPLSTQFSNIIRSFISTQNIVLRYS
jgi:hypothetical protein